jgi:hypothetical protein
VDAERRSLTLIAAIFDNGNMVLDIGSRRPWNQELASVGIQPDGGMTSVAVETKQDSGTRCRALVHNDVGHSGSIKDV